MLPLDADECHRPNAVRRNCTAVFVYDVHVRGKGDMNEAVSALEHHAH